MKKGLACALGLLCLVMTIGTAFYLVMAVMDCGSLIMTSGFAKSQEAMRYSIIVLLGIPLRVMSTACFITFAISIMKRKIFFARGQSIRLLAIGVSLMLEVVLQLMLPEMTSPASALLSSVPSVVGPKLDLQLLSFSLMFFALAGVFEYGRILQEESDDIL